MSIVSIGMGNPNVDFFVREVRECLNGDLVIVRSIIVPQSTFDVTLTVSMVSVRLGSCGALIDVGVGTVIIPKSSIAVNRNYDFDFVSGSTQGEQPYRTSKPVRSLFHLLSNKRQHSLNHFQGGCRF